MTKNGVIKKISLSSIEALGDNSVVTDTEGDLPNIDDVPTRKA